ncbi:MAG: hypothetical protein RL012_434 [Bacteroidota bacterium]|jgi:hypothetical protein
MPLNRYNYLQGLSEPNLVILLPRKNVAIGRGDELTHCIAISYCQCSRTQVKVLRPQKRTPMHKTARLAILSMLLVAALGTSLWFLLRKEIYVPKPSGYPQIVLLAHESLYLLNF